MSGPLEIQRILCKLGACFCLPFEPFAYRGEKSETKLTFTVYSFCEAEPITEHEHHKAAAYLWDRSWMQ